MASGANTPTNTENTAIENAAFTTNIFPSFLIPIKRNGRLRTIVSMLSDIPVRFLIIMPIPITPPSRIVLGTRNSSIAKAAITAPTASIM